MPNFSQTDAFRRRQESSPAGGQSGAETVSIFITSHILYTRLDFGTRLEILRVLW